MERTSTLYKTEVKKQFAGPALLRIRFGMIDTDAAATCAEPEGSACAAYARPGSMLREEGTPTATYATFEPGRMRADGRQLILPARADMHLAEGFVSAELSDGRGAFAADHVPTVRLRFSKTHTVPGLTFTFDATTGDYAAQMRVTALCEGAAVLDKTYTPNAAIWASEDEIVRFDTLELRFLRTNVPFRRLRLQQILFGFGLVFENPQIQKASCKTEVDPISRRLPTSTLEFSVVNVNALTGSAQHLYDPDNLAGVYKYIAAQSPITVSYGQMLTGGMRWSDAQVGSWSELELSGWREVYEGGVTEWVPGGRYYLTAQPTVDGLTATFKAQHLLAHLENVYENGVYAPEGRSLYALALEILEHETLPKLDPNDDPWHLWDGLRNIMTTGPLPKKKAKELLQLIAHAGCCTLYTDRRGYVCILPATQEQQAFKLDFDAMHSPPKVSQIPTLRAVECKAYSYWPDEKVEELYKQTHTVVGEMTLHATYPQAAELSVTASGGITVASAALYAGAADLILRGNGVCEVIVTGRKLQQSAQTVSAAVQQPDENGSVETLDNLLITSSAHALLVAQWVRDYLLLRNTYECGYRGSPELDVGDLVTFETQFAPFSAPARILKHELSFSGGLSGTVTAKRMVNS